VARESARRSRRPFLALTLGDPAGVGPWVAAAAALDRAVTRRCRPLLVGDAWVLHRFYGGRAVRVLPLAHLDDYRDKPGLLNVLHVPHPGIRGLVLGRPQKLAGEAAALALRCAAALALERRVAAVVTGPVSKESFHLAGLPYPGHTEMLAALSGARGVEMLMAAGPLKALLVTRHLPLRDVPRRLTVRALADAVKRVNPWLAQVLGRAKARWAVCGLNPHAGDGGLLGSEEQRVVIPALRLLRAAGVAAEGPLPADVAWARHASGAFDAVACLYHDQGMIPLKTLYPSSVVNITVGLPWVRTSPGHGTAYDLARGPKPYRRADPTATRAAALQALDIAEAFSLA
jgi:4-phospho-D-threonate 3-dehydrogenase / 4-phospho-D-erythronate 3-dehydrogenase